MINSANATWSAGNLTGANGAVFSNLLGATFNNTFDGNLAAGAGATPTFIPALAPWAVILERRGDPMGARREMVRARSRGDPKWLEAWRSASPAVLAGSWKEAIEAYTEILSLERSSRGTFLGSALESRLSGGSARLDAGNVHETIEDFVHAEALWPDLWSRPTSREGHYT